MIVNEESEKVGLKLNIQKTKIIVSCPIISWEIDGETVETVSDFILGGSKITADGDCSHEIKRCLLLESKVMTNLDSILKSRHYFVNRGQSSQGYGFSSSHVWMWELDCEESWVPKNWCFWTVVLEKTLESPLDCKEIQLVHSKGDQSWCSLEGMMLKLKLQYFGHLMRRVASLKRLWCWEGLGAGGEGATEDEMAGWHHRLNGHESEWTPGVGDGQGGLACCDSWGYKVRHDWATELNVEHGDYSQ